MAFPNIVAPLAILLSEPHSQLKGPKPLHFPLAVWLHITCEERLMLVKNNKKNNGSQQHTHQQGLKDQT